MAESRADMAQSRIKELEAAAGDALKTVIGTEAFCEAFLEQNPEKIEEIFSDYLWNTISIRDTASSKKENFYHGIACYKKNCKVVLG